MLINGNQKNTLLVFMRINYVLVCGNKDGTYQTIQYFASNTDIKNSDNNSKGVAISHFSFNPDTRFNTFEISNE